MAPSFTPEEDSRKVRLEKSAPSKTTNIGRNLNKAQQDELIKLLIDNQDIFAWKPSDMLGIPEEDRREFPEHPGRCQAGQAMLQMV